MSTIKPAPPSREAEIAARLEAGPIPLNELQQQSIKHFAAGDRLWTTQETVEINLRTVARTVLSDDQSRLDLRYLLVQLQQARQEHIKLEDEIVAAWKGDALHVDANSNLHGIAAEMAKLRDNEGTLLRSLSDRLTGGNASTWDEILHAAETAEAALQQAREAHEQLMRDYQAATHDYYQARAALATAQEELARLQPIPQSYEKYLAQLRNRR